MNLRALENLYRIRQIGSFSEVAAMANTSLSTLSMQMKALEAELGVDLFDRTHRPPRLTPLGRTVADKARDVVEAQSALKDICALSPEPAGHFRLGFTESASQLILPPLLRQLQSTWPRASFEFTSGLSEGLCAQVRADALDAAIVTAVPGAMEGLHSAALFEEPMVLVHDVDAGDGFMDQPFLHFQPRSGIGVLIGQYLADQGIRPLLSIQLDSIQAILKSVALGGGFSLLPRRSVEAANLDLHMRPLPEVFVRQVVLITPDSPRAERWRDPLVKAVHAVLDES
ncbi:MAG: LysR family transcriptional regulator [Rhodobacteraceae bacterium]|nr:LysR family transcriptional regulator [Paracoccaceae bacterium]